MAYLESQSRLELSKEEMLWVKKQYAKQTRSPRIREAQKIVDREYFVSILNIVHEEGHMTKDNILKLTNWTPAQYSTRMTKLIKDHPHQIKYNKNLKRVDKVKSSKRQEKLA